LGDTFEDLIESVARDLRVFFIYQEIMGTVTVHNEGYNELAARMVLWWMAWFSTYMGTKYPWMPCWYSSLETTYKSS
jgi:hypothetical protein